jgi:hypothetical protein
VGKIFYDSHGPFLSKVYLGSALNHNFAAYVGNTTENSDSFVGQNRRM